MIRNKDKKRISDLENEMIQKDYLIKRLMNMIKALIRKTENNEIIIGENEIKEAEKFEIYETHELLRFARKYQVVDKTKLNRISGRVTNDKRKFNYRSKRI